MSLFLDGQYRINEQFMGDVDICRLMRVHFETLFSVM